MTAAASYIVDISPTSADRTNVGGTASLGGTVQAAFASGSYVTRAYTILSAAGGLNGTTFNALTTSNLPANFTPSLSYTATDVILNLTATLGALTPLSGPNAPSACAFSVNQCNVANAINAFFNNGGTLPPAFVNIFGLTGVNLGNALSQLSGEAATGAQQAAFQLTNQFLGSIRSWTDGAAPQAAAGPRSALHPGAKSCPTTSRSPTARYSRRRRSRRASISAGRCGAQAMAAAIARQAIPRWSAATICPRAPRAARPGSIIISRATAWWASRSPAAAPTGAWRRGDRKS